MKDKNLNWKMEADMDIILSPEFIALKAEVEKLRTEMSLLLLEKDELLLVECKNIEMSYMLILGNLEYRAYELQCAVLRLKRKIEIIQAKKNRQEKIDISNIEKSLDEEFSEYKKKLDEQIDKMNDALERSKCEVLSAEESNELKKLYRQVVKALHPDLNPNISKAQLNLFNNAVSAYENGDLNSLRLISAMVAEPVLSDCEENSMETLKNEKKRLIELIGVVYEMIKKIKNEYPYILKPILKSEEEINKRKSELEVIISQLAESLEFYKVKIAEMLR